MVLTVATPLAQVQDAGARHLLGSLNRRLVTFLPLPQIMREVLSEMQVTRPLSSSPVLPIQQ
jgi:hypothetical protein